MKRLLLLLLWASSAQAAPFSWPDGRQAAIVLTYDDAIRATDLIVVGPQLDKAGLKGTFFLMGKSVRAEDVPLWRALATSGHELGNHSVNHPCRRGAYDMPPQYNTESYSVSVMLTEVGTMNAFLTALDGKPSHAFAVPCGHTTLADGDYIAPLKAVGLASSIRDTPDLPAPPDGPKLMENGFVGASGADMIAWVKQVEAAGGLGVVVFHGVGGDYLSVSAEAHQQLVDYLAAHRATIWTTTYSDAVGYARRSH